MELKRYQQNSLDVLKEYLEELKKFGPKHSFISITEKPYKGEFFDEIPYVCIKIPTGGGKTLVATHSINEIMDIVLKNKLDRGIVMWFVPSEAIKSQTLRKLKDRKDFHRQVLDEYFDNKVKIFSNEEALRIKKSDVDSNICIIISSLEAFRKEKKLQLKYKVYQENGELIEHFSGIINDSKLEKDEFGTIINSLANVIRLNSPLIIIDEGHRTKTKLSIEFLKGLNPSFLIEFTATPRIESNVLFSVHSSELKEEKMVKIPLILESVSQWQEAIKRGVFKRKELEKEAKEEMKKTGEYIRPITLLQAQQEKESKNKVTVEKIKNFLIKDMHVPEEEIAIKTSSRNELKNIDLSNKKCKIRYIITVNALAEGWDCSFAYILISVANIGSKISVEQTIGRIVRLPHVKKKINENLNFSYIFASAKNFNEAAEGIIKDLEKNGFSAKDLINNSEKFKRYEFESKKVIKQEISIPLFSFKNEELGFADLIGEDFRLSKQNHEFDFQIHYDNDGRIKLDIEDKDEWIKERQTFLPITYEDRDFSEKELINWLDKKLKFIMLDKEDKTLFIKKAIKYQLKRYTLSELSVNRFVLKDEFNKIIKAFLIKRAKEKFFEFIKKRQINLKESDKFKNKIIISNKVNEEFKKNAYDSLGKVNKEELSFIERLDTESLPNIIFWVRNREKQDPFYLQGWKPNKFYPDFIAFTKKGNILVLEWKGLDRISNEDTKYKVELAKQWERLSDKLHFFLVNKNNEEEVLNKLRKID